MTTSKGRPPSRCGAILGAIAVTGKRLRDQQIVFLGAGSAAVGVADYLRAALVQDGLSETEARSRFWLVDKDGLLHSGRTDLTPEQQVYAQPTARVANWPRTSHGTIGLADVIGQIEATVLIGLSTVGGAFTEPIVREMARKVERPVIFPLSNPTTRSEASAEDLIRWTAGRALVATGSPYAPVSYEGGTIPIAQCNNVFIFPAVGLGVVAAASPTSDRRDDAGRGPSAGRTVTGPHRSVGLAACPPSAKFDKWPERSPQPSAWRHNGPASRRRRVRQSCKTASSPRSGSRSTRRSRSSRRRLAPPSGLRTSTSSVSRPDDPGKGV